MQPIRTEHHRSTSILYLSLKFTEGDPKPCTPLKIPAATDDTDALVDDICYYIYGQLRACSLNLLVLATEVGALLCSIDILARREERNRCLSPCDT